MTGQSVGNHAAANATTVEEEIRLTAELIFDVLYREGEMSLEQLKEKVSHRVPFFEWGIGWLAGKGDIEITPQSCSFRIRRTPPAPAVFPLRGD